MQKLVWQNSNGDVIDLTSGYYGITNWEGFSNTSLNIQSQQVPFQDGGVFLDALMEQRELSVTLAIYDGNDLEKRYQYRRELIHILNPKLGEGYLIYTNNFTSKRIKCVAQIPLFETHNSNDSGTPKASLAWTACEPYWEDLEERYAVVSRNTQATINNTGDVPVGIKATIVPLSTAENITLRNDNKRIGLNGNFDKIITLNTNVGEKEVYENELVLNIEELSMHEEKKIYNLEDLGYFILLCDNMIFKSTDGTSYKCVYTLESDGYEYTPWCYKLYFSNKMNKLYVTVQGLTNGKLLEGNVDGDEWHLIDTGFSSDNVTAICDSDILNGLILVGSNGLYASSTDGQTWLRRATSYNEDFLSILEVNGKIFVGGFYTNIKSSDGISWTNLVGSLAYEITYIPEYSVLFLCGAGGTTYSLDLENFSNLDNLNNAKSSICYSQRDNCLVSVTVGSDYTKIFKSTDIINWDEVYEFVGYYQQGAVSNIVYSEYWNIFIAVGHYCLCTSVDLINWRNVITEGGLFLRSAYKHNKLVFLCTDDGLYCSENNNLTKVINTEAGNNMYKVLKCGDYYYAISSLNIFRSKTGTENWQIVFTVQTEQTYIRDIAFSEDKNIIVVVAGNYVIYSKNGVDWYNIQKQTSSNSVDYDGEKFIAVGFSDVYESYNGIDWTSFILSDIDYVDGVASSKEYGYSLFFASIEESPSSRKSVIVKYYKNGNHIIYDFPFSESDNIIDISYSSYYGLFFLLLDSGKIFITQDGENLHNYLYVVTGLSFINATDENVLVGDEGVYNIILKRSNNIIDTVNSDSDMSLKLMLGENIFNLNSEGGNVSASIGYRQKYIGV